jgi:hypothetical protein
MHQGTYRGVPLEDLRIDSVLWPDDRAEYIRTRSTRRKNDKDVEPEWATEAATSEGAEVSWAPPPEGSDALESESLLVLGYADMVRAVLKVWLRPAGDVRSGEWLGVNGAFAKKNVEKQFMERRSK